MGEFICIFDGVFNHNFSRRLHRRALHHTFNNGGIRERPFFHAIRSKVGDDEASDDEDDYRERPNQFRVYRQQFEWNLHQICSEFLFLCQPITIALLAVNVIF